MKAFVFLVVVVLAFVVFLHVREWQEARTGESGPASQPEIVNVSPAAGNSDPPAAAQTTVSERRPQNAPAADHLPIPPRTGIPERPASPPAAAMAGSEQDAREYIVVLDRVTPGDGALAHGGFFQHNSLPPPRYRSPLDERPGDGPPAEEPTRGWMQSGGIFIAGLPDGYAEGDRFHGWLVRTGARTILTDDGKQRTVAAYRIVPQPQSASTTPKPGEWMFRKNRRTLDPQR